MKRNLTANQAYHQCDGIIGSLKCGHKVFPDQVGTHLNPLAKSDEINTVHQVGVMTAVSNIRLTTVQDGQQVLNGIISLVT